MQNDIVHFETSLRLLIGGSRINMNQTPNHIASRGKHAAVRIRPFRIADLPRIMEIERKAFPDAWDESWFLYFFQTNSNGFIVAVEGREHIVGYAVVDIEAEEEYAWLYAEGTQLPPERGHLLNIAVDEKYRSRGVGSMLLEAVFKYVLERGVDTLFLEVQTTNSEAKRFYKARGFSETGNILRDYYPDGGDAIVMKKDLNRDKKTRLDS